MRSSILLLLLFLSSNLISKPCFSDFNCKLGQTCIKFNYDFRGICADAVDEYGNKNYTKQPDPESIKPNDGKGSCQFDTDCPIDFQCYKKAGGLFGHCFK